MSSKWQDKPASESALAFIASLCEQVGWPLPPEGQVATKGQASAAIDKLKAAREAKWAQERAERDAEYAEAMQSVAPWKPGRQEFEGEVVSSKMQDGMYGVQMKMLVVTPDGKKVWSSVPAKVAEAYTCEELKGCGVDVVATLKPKDEEPHFAFASRPTVRAVHAKAKVVA